ncbi:hypothetical protein [Prosthecomicrobium hirschii]|uniref:hypothetical protein n=1 Tax=Prosthecodimorpha hirschii TaxID=665126 RepID=UPI002220F340|nr:hypothetical protein [Prosthecomicrobium hirschii]MCW1843583.1 hypothetical protein [Prosthecomicrobium hirschii]
MVEFKNREAVEAWLANRPQGVAVVLAARAALRVLPALALSTNTNRNIRDDAFLILRASVVSWLAAKFSTYDTELLRAAAYAASNAAMAAADDAATAATVSNASKDAAAFAAAAFAADTFAAGASVAPTSAATAYTAASIFGTAQEVAAFAADGTAIDGGASPAALAGLPLWPQDTPKWVTKAWADLKRRLLDAGDDWDVWTDWYEARLAGKRPWRRSLEIARATLPDELWEQGPKAVNAEIKRLITAEKAKAAAKRQAPRKDVRSIGDLEPLDIPSPVPFKWQDGVIALGGSALPVLGPRSDQRDLARKMQACREIAKDISAKIAKRRYNCRIEYREHLEGYLQWFPEDDDGNIYLADRHARAVRELLVAELDELPLPFVADMKGFLEQHIGIRPHFPELLEFFESVRTHALPAPLPQDAVDQVRRAIAEATPEVFAPNVGQALDVEGGPPSTVEQPSAAGESGISKIELPPDPIQGLNPESEKAGAIARTLNFLLKVYKQGAEFSKNLEAWEKFGVRVFPYMYIVIQWLQAFLGY